MGLAKVHCGATPPSVMVLYILHFRNRFVKAIGYSLYKLLMLTYLFHYSGSQRKKFHKKGISDRSCTRGGMDVMP